MGVLSATQARTGSGRIRLIIVAVLSVAVGLYGLWYFTGRPAPQGIADNHAGMACLVVHATSSGLALLLGPWQFWPGIRARRPWLHRLVGRSYLAACLIGGTSGLFLALNTTAGPVAQGGFGMLAVAWLGVNAMGYGAALRRDFVTHRRWMIRSFALTFAAVTLRIYLAIAEVSGAPIQWAYPLISWICWVPNLAVAQAWLLRRPLPAALARV